MSKPIILEDEGVDDLLKGELKLIQKKRGYRYSVDALLLSSFALPADNETVADLGCAGGVISLILAARSNPKSIAGIEIQRTLAGMAKRNVRLNSLENKIRIFNRDIKNLSGTFKKSSFDLVVSNPPFIKKGAGHLSASKEKAVARHELKIDLAGIVRAAYYLVKPGGRVCLIYPMNRLEEVKQRLALEKLAISRIQFAFDQKGGEPKLFCIEAKKTRATEFIQLKPVYIQTSKGKFSV